MKKMNLVALVAAMLIGAVTIVPATQTSAISMPNRLYCLDLSTRPQTGWTEGCGYTKSECARYGSNAVRELKPKYPKVKYSCRAQ